MSVRYGVPYENAGRQARLRNGAIRVLRVIADPRWSTLGSLIAAGASAAWMMVVLLKHVPLRL